MKIENGKIPTFDALMIPVLLALKDLGGSGTIDEINEKVYEIAHIPKEIIEIPHSRGYRNIVEYRLTWTKSYLKKAGLIESSSRGVWALTDAELDIASVDIAAIVKSVRALSRKEAVDGLEELTTDENTIEDAPDWKSGLLNILLSLEPDAFERLAQRILRESGFTHVEVTGKSGDGGIDGKGIAKINGFLSFHVIFQCKRFKNSVSASLIRDFRGAMQGRADKGLYLTTGTYTRDAIKEATRDGAPPIDLIDGDTLCEKLRELNLGVKTRTIEIYEPDEDWFRKL
ncbi:MAG: restriction endonuclease [Ignavibacteria bacterium]|nr:restriction endonuclease [Ignavibacteria bacterium]